MESKYYFFSFTDFDTPQFNLGTCWAYMLRFNTGGTFKLQCSDSV